MAQERLVRRDQGIPGGGIDIGEVVQGERRHCGSLPGWESEKKILYSLWDISDQLAAFRKTSSLGTERTGMFRVEKTICRQQARHNAMNQQPARH